MLKNMHPYVRSYVVMGPRDCPTWSGCSAERAFLDNKWVRIVCTYVCKADPRPILGTNQQCAARWMRHVDRMVPLSSRFGNQMALPPLLHVDGWGKGKAQLIISLVAPSTADTPASRLEQSSSPIDPKLDSKMKAVYISALAALAGIVRDTETTLRRNCSSG